ncbi:FadR/GntR family transcriptional regulator [Arthrobacter sp. FW306-2-2C-D06B]|uniref:FadR/GntR family transcriptional regulator n=1 Tax=Arthrobacter sp. FW306-2-2C-D06B TaxID=2879618 RepID=UPI001F31E652|nr:FCD domain-containing protein [Arthrobacter sp. FW306-2-2C-D06B]UKA60429.1 FCD domain-containing protein [Arthrobacter sp. FW306-2-2C-D06B]
MTKDKILATDTPFDLRALFLTPVVDGSLVQQTIRRLTEAIGIGLLQGRERLPAEPELAELLDIAPMTLREALAVMRRAGYLETVRGRTGGTFIAQISTPSKEAARQRLESIDAGFLRDLSDYRRAISVQAAALASERATETEILGLERQVVRIRAAETFVEYLQLDAQFHIAIAASSGATRLWREQIRVEMETGGITLAAAAQPSRFHPDLMMDHDALVQAIRDRDPVRARAVTAAHINRGCEALIELCLGHGHTTDPSENDGKTSGGADA